MKFLFVCKDLSTYWRPLESLATAVSTMAKSFFSDALASFGVCLMAFNSFLPKKWVISVVADKSFLFRDEEEEEEAFVLHTCL